MLQTRAYKTELNPTAEQKQKIKQTIGVCRFVYNLFLAENKARHEAGEAYMGAKAFSVWLNNDYRKAHPEKKWIWSVSSKAVKKAIENAHTAYQRFFSGKSRFPRFKRKGKDDPSIYFVNGNRKQTHPLVEVERHRIKIPTLGFVQLKEKGYIPGEDQNHKILSGTITVKSGRFYVSILSEEPASQKTKPQGPGIGIDLGIKTMCVTSDGRECAGVNKSERVKRLEKKLKRAQRCLARKRDAYRDRKAKAKPGEIVSRKNLDKQILEVQKICDRITRIRIDNQNKIICELVKTKPAYITIEDLNVSGMMKNRHLAKSIAAQRFRDFRTKLERKCHDLGIEVRVVSPWYPSSKTCHNCGTIKKDLKLKDRTFQCPHCGFIMDRDLNAALNLRDASKYTVI